MIDTKYLTGTQKRIISVLGDGLFHNQSELKACLNDELTTVKTLSVHLVKLREKIRPMGYGIETVINLQRRKGQRVSYRLVRKVLDPSTG